MKIRQTTPIPTSIKLPINIFFPSLNALEFKELIPDRTKQIPKVKNGTNRPR